MTCPTCNTTLEHQRGTLNCQVCDTTFPAPIVLGLSTHTTDRYNGEVTRPAPPTAAPARRMVIDGDGLTWCEKHMSAALWGRGPLG